VIEELGTDVVWTPPEVVGGVAWRVRVEPGAHQPRHASDGDEPLVFFGAGAWEDSGITAGRETAERSMFGCTLGAAPAGTPAVTSLARLMLAWLVRRARRARG
jgi:hypothetical protein